MERGSNAPRGFVAAGLVLLAIGRLGVLLPLARVHDR
jgi:hypothetical protein